MEYTVDPPAVRDDAGTISGALEVLGTVHIGAHLAPVREAFAGGATAAAVGQVQEEWERQLTWARQELRGIGGALAVAADGYAAAEAFAGRILASDDVRDGARQCG